MTKEEFLKHEAEKNGITVEKFEEILQRNNEEVIKCCCGRTFCRGWIIPKRNI